MTTLCIIKTKIDMMYWVEKVFSELLFEFTENLRVHRFK